MENKSNLSKELLDEALQIFFNYLKKKATSWVSKKIGWKFLHPVFGFIIGYALELGIQFIKLIGTRYFIKAKTQKQVEEAKEAFEKFDKAVAEGTDHEIRDEVKSTIYKLIRV